MIFLFPSVNIFITEIGASKQLLNICLESALEQSFCQQPRFLVSGMGNFFMHFAVCVLGDRVPIKPKQGGYDFNILYLKSTQF